MTEMLAGETAYLRDWFSVNNRTALKRTEKHASASLARKFIEEFE